MTRRLPVVRLIVFVASFLATACGSPSSSGSQAPVVPLTPVYGSGPVDQPMQVSLSLIADSSGKGPDTGNTVEVLFGPDGKAMFLALGDSGTLSYNGTWSLSSGQVTVDFQSPDFTRHGTFAMTYTTAPLAIPFQVFTEKGGSSTWTVAAVDPAIGALDMAYAAAAASTDGIAPADYVSAAADYAAAVTGAPEQVRTAAFVPANSTPAPQLDAACAPKITEVDKFPDSVELRESCGASVAIPLLSPGAVVDGATGPLTPGKFTSVPRIDDNPKRPGNGKDDPKTKRAVIFEPFAGDRTFTVATTSKGSVTLTVSGFANENTNAEAALSADGYEVQSLANDKATLANLIDSVSKGTPGFLYFDSHGDSQGDLLTSDFLGSTPKAANDAITQISTSSGVPANDFKAGYVDVSGLHGQGTSAPKKGTFTRAYMLTLKPAFWSWLEANKGADFGHSLVYIAACDTDQTDSLRNAIKARAYFAFNSPVPPLLTNATGHYLTALLRKPTFTAEEAYYNMLRIDSQRTTVYSDDDDFKGVLDPGGVNSRSSDKSVTQSGIVDILDAYGSNGGNPIPYRGNGWLTSGVSEGQIFYLLTAARAGSDEDIKKGQDNLKTCWDSWWSQGTLPGVLSPYCQQWNDGSAPSQDEYDYTLYLLTGEDQAFAGTKVPRFTLNDGGS
jgi:hypothetical protein